MPTFHRPIALASAIALPVFAAPALGQNMMIMEHDDGSGSFGHFTSLDLGSRKPDFERGDLPIFTRSLVLGETQQTTVEALLNAYLEDFALLGESFGFKDGPMSLRLLGGPDGDAAILLGDALPKIEGHLDGAEMTFDVEVQSGGAVAQRVVVGDAGVGEGPQAGVFIAIDSGDGELPPELLEELEARAAEMAEKLHVQMEAGGGEEDFSFNFDPEEHMAHLEEMKAKTEEFKTDKEELKEKFLGEVREQLAEEQLERWPQLERSLRRHKTMSDDRLDGEGTDLLRLIDELGLAESQPEALAEVMQQYELLDHALVLRNDFVPGAQKKVDEALQSGNPQDAVASIDRATRLRLGVRLVNDEYSEIIASQLDEPADAEFRRSYLQARLPLATYRSTRAERAFEQAMKHEDLTEDTRLAVEALTTSYANELTPVQDGIYRAIRRYQPDESRRSVERIAEAMEAGPGGGLPFFDDREDSPIRQAIDRRDELDARYIRELRATVPEEIAATLPEPERQRSGPIVIQRGDMGDRIMHRDN